MKWRGLVLCTLFCPRGSHRPILHRPAVVLLARYAGHALGAALLGAAIGRSRRRPGTRMDGTRETSS